MSELTDMLGHPFVRHALFGGTAIAAACGLVGWFLVIRSQVFSADALSHVAFTGALVALTLGVDIRLGLFVATIGIGAGLGLLGDRGQPDDVVIGAVFTWILGLGVLFLSIFTVSDAAGDGTTGTKVLFGSIFGLSTEQAAVAVVVGILICVAVLVIARPLLFSSIDHDVAAARGIPTRLLGIVFLGLVGACAAEATQAVGALLLLGLIAAPAAAAHRLTSRPYVALALAPGIAVVCVWIGVTGSYLVSDVPPSFGIVAAATTAYLLSLVVSIRRRERRWAPGS